MKGGAVILGLGLLAVMLSLWAQDIVVPAAPTNATPTNAPATNGLPTNKAATNALATNAIVTNVVPTNTIPGSTTNVVKGTNTNAVPPKPLRPMKIGNIDYRIIVRKNPFRLILPEPEVIKTNEPLELTILAPVRLTGITTVNGEPKALLMAGGRASSKRYLVLGAGMGEDLGEGIRKSRLMVKSIDAKAGKVVIENKGKEFELMLEDEVKLEPFGAPEGTTSQSPALPIVKVDPPDPPEPVKPSIHIAQPEFQPGASPIKRRSSTVFDPNIQAITIEANQIPALSELPRGQLSTRPPTDLPEERH